MAYELMNSKARSLNTMERPKHGEIWMCRFEEGKGSVQGGYRPAFIASNDINNKHSKTINVIPITSKMNKRNLPVHVELWEYQKFGLKRPSTLMVEQLMTIDRNILDKKVGRIWDSEVLGLISQALRIQLPFLN